MNKIFNFLLFRKSWVGQAMGNEYFIGMSFSANLIEHTGLASNDWRAAFLHSSIHFGS